ncbi:MAG TPA: bifunctional phosphopantothenoylcysteine decarboxylase/phosphopantothenate--cysteine ligase CoaBC [Deltaproteobacteria bacterium]|nr:bifunctional phosphopantothenoylcysteine decarboxylase/phosphopantothenate--cysteine ligase CoaBC [Deltaproteobacteria bacterium]HOM28263.1 bifunctional phosphopantothenoylcysteine decarboxylase/phosphopantothenate--cysteine ligase CoaBC [Deltaproteobacteria bacterium]HPP79478.1 bifunctional phosphopantothenoylcysteine decarboxylase/phosphopantothenate--cysteine ligase CoaBC [Deltaproteobacteria bacterium]
MGHTAGEDLEGKTVVYGVTGGIAAYKAPLVARGLKALGVDVHAVMTHAALHFVTPLVMRTLTGNEVHVEMFPETMGSSFEIDHISLADRADLFLVAPATADFIAKLACGMADDLLSCSILATRAPVLVCPSMNVNMLQNRVTQENLDRLKQRGFHVLEPTTGELACGWEGAGRLPEPGRIVQEVRMLMSEHDLSGIRVLITSGPTCEDIDPVRFITNRSTGKMGAALVEAACIRGARVKVVSGPVAVDYAPWAEITSVRSAREMLDAVKDCLGEVDVLIMAAAVADYTPHTYSTRKIKKGEKTAHIELTSTPDILATIRPFKESKVFVGFAAETDNLKTYAQDKMVRKGLDMIVANRVGDADSGFASDTNSGVILSPEGVMYDFENMGKDLLAHRILDLVKERL